MMECRNVATKTNDELTPWYERHGLPPQTGESEGTSDNDTVTIKRTAFEEIFHDAKRNDVRSGVVMAAYAEVMQGHVKGIVDMVASAKRNGLWVEFNPNDVESFDDLIELLKEEEIISGTEDAKDAIHSAMETIRHATEAAEKARSDLEEVAYSISGAITLSEESESYCDDARSELDGIEL
jgi:hypothetical protein